MDGDLGAVGERHLVLDDRAVDDRLVVRVEVGEPDLRSGAGGQNRRDGFCCRRRLARTSPLSSCQMWACLRETTGMLMQMSEDLALFPSARARSATGRAGGRRSGTECLPAKDVRLALRVVERHLRLAQLGTALSHKSRTLLSKR